MASADKPPVERASSKAARAEGTAIDFLPDADEIERRPLPFVARLTLHLLVAALACFLTWASLSEVDLIVNARGRLSTPLPNIVVQPLETSIIQTIAVRAGQVVKKGDTLATLDATFTEADESQLKSRQVSLNTQLASIEAELAGKPTVGAANASADGQIQSRLSTERQATYQSQIRRQTELAAKLRSSLETARQDELALGSRVKVLGEMESMTDDLVNKKLAVKSRLLDARDRLLEAERGMEMARNRQIEIRRELSAVEAERTSFSTGWRQKMLEELLSVSRERDAVNDQLQKANRRRSLVVMTAPADAVVLEVAKLSQGSIIREAEAFFTLVPLGGVLEADVQIESPDVGYVKVGDTAAIKLDAYPFQKHGTLPGSLRTISEDTFRRDAGTGPSKDSYYTGRITISSFHLDNMPERSKLLPGMTLTTEIIVGKRSVISYLLWPLTKALNESIREP